MNRLIFDYFTLLNREPIHIEGLGTLNKTKLSDIEKITYQKYKGYLSILMLDLNTFYKSTNKEKYDWYISLTDEEKSKLSIYDEIVLYENLQQEYVNAFNFFIKEDVVYDKENMSFVVVVSENNEMNIVGVIARDTFSYVCDCILEIHKAGKPKEKKKKVFKNKLAERVWKMTHKNEEDESNVNPKLDLANIISAFAGFNQSCNIVNIWDMTVYQLYDQFQRQDFNVYYNISSKSVSIWGDRENKFDFSKWYDNIFESSN